jgi:ligand-binding sensor domain-containing protein
LSNDFPVTDIYALAGNKKALFIGTSDGLFVYDRELGRITDRMTERNGLLEPEVSAMQLVGDSLFVGTTGGIALLDFPRDSITYPYPITFYNTVTYDFELVDRTLWIASERGAYRLNLDTGELFKFEDPDIILFSRVYALDRYGDELGLLGDDGFVRLNLKTGKTKGYKATTVHIGNNLYPFPGFAINDRVAAVSSPNGFALFFEDKRKPVYREFGSRDGLPSENVMELDFDGDYLWVGTDRGLSSFWWNNPNRVD